MIAALAICMCLTMRGTATNVAALDSTTVIQKARTAAGAFRFTRFRQVVIDDLPDLLSRRSTCTSSFLPPKTKKAPTHEQQEDRRQNNEEHELLAR